jgi:hypothetical protein
MIIGIKKVCLTNDVTSEHAGMRSLSSNTPISASGVPRNFVWEGVSTNSVEDTEQGEWGSGGCSP